jgi:glycerol-3-phosphate dehydrogenase
MAETDLDLLVIGGGITGAGIALDAASRGLSVALVERDDFAAGTSGRSSRMIHGGVRYLEHYDFGLVHGALRERVAILRLAPHLVRPITMCAPTGSLRQHALFRLGLAVYDTLAVGRNLGRHGAVDAAEMHRAAPGLGRPTRGVRYWECRTDDARLTLEAVRAAKRHGALIANHAEVVSLTGEVRVRGARMLDHLTGDHLEVRARITVNATGVWADAIHGMAADAPPMLRPSKGVHVVFRSGAVDTGTALFVPSGAGDRRFVFIIPWGDRVYAGTTDTEYHGGLDDPPVTDVDLHYVLDAVAAAFPGVTRSDVTASWAGLRPLLGGARGPTADLSRKHRIFEDPPGLLTITGGKLTTYRAMAEDLVDRAARTLGTGGPCRTREIPLGLDRTARRSAGAGHGGRRVARPPTRFRPPPGDPVRRRLAGSPPPDRGGPVGRGAGRARAPGPRRRAHPGPNTGDGPHRGRRPGPADAPVHHGHERQASHGLTRRHPDANGGQGSRTPGLRTPEGSRARLTARRTPRPSSPSSLAMNRAFSRPTP